MSNIPKRTPERDIFDPDYMYTPAEDSRTKLPDNPRIQGIDQRVKQLQTLSRMLE